MKRKIVKEKKSSIKMNMSYNSKDKTSSQIIQGRHKSKWKEEQKKNLILKIKK